VIGMLIGLDAGRDDLDLLAAFDGELVSFLAAELALAVSFTQLMTFDFRRLELRQITATVVAAVLLFSARIVFAFFEFSFDAKFLGELPQRRESMRRILFLWPPAGSRRATR
jgi:hypothetical protein